MTEVVETAPLLEPQDGIPDVVGDDAGLANAALHIASGTGPLALDTERASGFRYSSRAYLIQMRREGVGTILIDPIGISDFSPLQRAMKECEWILHAATQDLGCLTELGLEPTTLFDTEHAGRLLGKPKVGLSSLLESELGVSLAKEHSAADWSTRPLPMEWLNYAALDVELLLELRETLIEQLARAERTHWAEQDFDYLAQWRPPGPRPDGWRRISGIHTLKKPQQLAIARDLWLARDEIAQSKDKAPGRVLPDAAIIDIATKDLKTERDVYRLDTLRNRNHKALAQRWWHVRQATIEGQDFPDPLPKSGAIPPPKAWAERFPEAFARWSVVRPALNELADGLAVSPEIVVLPEAIRTLCWNTEIPLQDQQAVTTHLREHKVRPWQIELVNQCMSAITISDEVQ